METPDKFKNSPIHDKSAILEMLDKLNPAEMAQVVDFIKPFVEMTEEQKESQRKLLERIRKIGFDTDERKNPLKILFNANDNN